MQVHGRDSLLVLVGIMFLLGGVACQQERPQQAGEATPVDTAPIRAEIDSVRSGFEEAFNAGDFERAAVFVHPDMLYSPPGSPPIRGRDSVIAYDRSAFPSGATIEIDPIETRVLSAEWVYEYGISTVSFTPEGADMEQSVESTYLVIVRHTDDGWQVYRESLSSNSPMSGGS